jgi:hypothetical protein
MNPQIRMNPEDEGFPESLIPCEEDPTEESPEQWEANIELESEFRLLIEEKRKT